MIAGRPDAVLLDRDGTINVKAPGGEYVTSPSGLELLEGAAEAIRALNRAGVPVVVVTNQRGIALGRMTEDDLTAVHARMAELLAHSGASVQAIFHCPHEKGTCGCRKPGPGLLERARAHLGLSSLRRSVMIGDAWSDIVAGRAAGAQTVLLARSVRAAPPGTTVAPSLLDAVTGLLAR
jgi:D-glycero-D-manno-heptose 1,7-bisphosphate phosphatase